MNNAIITPTKEELYDIAYRINAKIVEYGMIECCVYTDEEHDMIKVDVIRGDWKHSHRMADIIAEELNGEKIGERVYESDGSDTYSSIHFYTFDKIESEKE